MKSKIKVCGVENFDNKFKIRKMYVWSGRYTPSVLNNIFLANKRKWLLILHKSIQFIQESL